MMNKKRPQEIHRKQDKRQLGNIDGGQTNKIKIRHDKPWQLAGKTSRRNARALIIEGGKVTLNEISSSGRRKVPSTIREHGSLKKVPL